MRVLRTIDSIKDYINSTLDRSIADHLAAHVAYVAGDEGGPLTVILVEPRGRPFVLPYERREKHQSFPNINL